MKFPAIETFRALITQLIFYAARIHLNIFLQMPVQDQGFSYQPETITFTSVVSYVDNGNNFCHFTNFMYFF